MDKNQADHIMRIPARSAPARGIALVLREMKRDAPHRVPRRIAVLQVRSAAARRLGDGRVNVCIQLGPGQ